MLVWAYFLCKKYRCI